MSHMRDSSWRTAISATLHCLTGCAIGEVLGMVISSAAGWASAPSIAISVVLAFFFGYLLTSLPLLRAGLALSVVIPLALASDTLSIVVMEIVDNAFMYLTGAMNEGLGDVLFWLGLGASLAIAFVITVPVNRVLIGRGKGHAVLHEHHAH